MFLRQPSIPAEVCMVEILFEIVDINSPLHDNHKAPDYPTHFSKAMSLNLSSFGASGIVSARRRTSEVGRRIA
jgi:hypothetical protein